MVTGFHSEEFFEGFLDDYFAESDEHLTGARRALLRLEESIETPAAKRPIVDELFRLFHSLKGISGMVELRPAEQLAHHLETYLRAVRQGDTALTADGIDALIDGTERLERIIAARRREDALPGIDDIAERVAQLVPPTGWLPAAAPSPADASDATPLAGVPHWSVKFSPSRDLLARGIGVDAVRKRLMDLGEIASAVPHVHEDGSIAFEFVVYGPQSPEAFDSLRADGLAVERVEATAPALEPLAAAVSDRTRLDAGTSRVAPSHVVRVDLTRLDELMRHVGDLVISRARLVESLARVEHHVPAGEWRGVQENTLLIDRQLRTLREGLMRVRLVPVGEIFRRMPFVVRDLARETGKRVKLDLAGQGTEIDKFLIERLMDPVLHLVRNAISHGIETPEERLAAGKRPDATLTLKASTAGDTVTIEIADDGRGIDAEAVAARARAAGLPVPSGALDEAALLRILCSPGFSTRDDSDRASGRGVGMAVAKTAVEQLSGSMSLETEPGAGTRFLMHLPLTLAITDALVARVGPETFAIPQGAVREVIEVAATDVRAIEQNELIPYRGGSLPLVRLAALVGLAAVARPRCHAFVIGTGGPAFALAVDRIVGQREIVVRTMADPLVLVDGISGATDLGDGRVVLILDPAALSRVRRLRGGQRPRAQSA